MMDEQMKAAFAQAVKEALRDALPEALAAALKQSKEPTQECFSIREVAAMLGVSEKHIRRALKSGSLKWSNIGTLKKPMPRIARQDINAWLEESRVKQAPPKSERDELVDHYFPKSRKRLRPVA